MSVPARLYKYRSLAGDSRNYTHSAIVDTEIYFPRYRDFNDPFDCRLNVRADGNDDLMSQMEAATTMSP